MTDKVLQLHKTPPQHDIVSQLRDLANQIEAGTVDGMPVITTCVCVLGHSESKLNADSEIEGHTEWYLYSWGPRCDMFTTRGLMATAIKG